MLVVNSNQAHIVSLMLINDVNTMDKKQHKHNDIIDSERERENQLIGW